VSTRARPGTPRPKIGRSLAPPLKHAGIALPQGDGTYQPIVDEAAMSKTATPFLCPEYGIPLDESVDLRARIEHLWPSMDERDPRFVEARKRRDILAAEAARREKNA